MNTNSEIAAAALKPGEQTSEFQVTQATGAWGIVLMVCGTITTILPQIIDSIKQAPQVADTQSGKTVIMVAGVLIAISGAVLRAASTMSYNQSRAIVKGAALRDISVEPAPAAPVTPPPAV
jgi:hypothetical protein